MAPARASREATVQESIRCTGEAESADVGTRKSALLAGRVSRDYSGVAVAASMEFNRFSFPHFSEAIMKAILSMAVVLAFCGMARAQGAKADPVGTWKCEYKIGDQDRTSTMTIKKDGDQL